MYTHPDRVNSNNMNDIVKIILQTHYDILLPTVFVNRKRRNCFVKRCLPSTLVASLHLISFGRVFIAKHVCCLHTKAVVCLHSDTFTCTGHSEFEVRIFTSPPFGRSLWTPRTKATKLQCVRLANYIARKRLNQIPPPKTKN
jgi:hypothetical protein